MIQMKALQKAVFSAFCFIEIFRLPETSGKCLFDRFYVHMVLVKMFASKDPAESVNGINPKVHVP